MHTLKQQYSAPGMVLTAPVASQVLCSSGISYSPIDDLSGIDDWDAE